MKQKNFFGIIGLLLLAHLHAQNFSIQWEETFGGTQYDGGMHVLPLGNGGYLFSGSSLSSDGDIPSNYGAYDIVVFKTDASGNLQNTFVYGGSQDDLGVRVLYDNNGGYFIIGASRSSDGVATHNYGNYDFWVISTQTNGNVLWQEDYGGSQVDYVRDAIMTPSGNIVMVGYTLSNDYDVSGNHGMADAWIISINKNTGLVNWQLTVGGSQNDEFRAVKQTVTGDFIATGVTTSSDGDLTGNNGQEDILVARISASGSLVWAKNFGGSLADMGNSLVENPANAHIYVAGQSSSSDGDFNSNQGASDAFLLELDAAGNLQWAQNYGGMAQDNFYWLVWHNNFLYATGFSYSNNGNVSTNYGDADVWVTKTDLSGTLVAEKNFGGSQYDNAHYMIANSSGNLVLSATTASNDMDVANNAGGGDLWAVELSTNLKVNNQMTMKWTIYPNPAQNLINIQSEQAFDEIKILDLSGRIIYSGHFDEPVNNYVVPLDKWKEGKYLLQLGNKSGLFTKMFIKK